MARACRRFWHLCWLLTDLHLIVKDEEEDEEEGEEEEAESQEYGDNERVAFVSSLRIDSIMKAGINMSKTYVYSRHFSRLPGVAIWVR